MASYNPMNHLEFKETIPEYNTLKFTGKIRKLSYPASVLAYVPALIVNMLFNIPVIAYMALFSLIAPASYYKKNLANNPNYLTDGDKNQISRISKASTKVFYFTLFIFSPIVALVTTAVNSIDIFKWLTVKNNYLLNCCRKPAALEIDNQFQSTDNQVKNQINTESAPLPPTSPKTTVIKRPAPTPTNPKKRFMTLSDLAPTNHSPFHFINFGGFGSSTAQSPKDPNNKNAKDDSTKEPKKTGIHTLSSLGK